MFNLLHNVTAQPTIETHHHALFVSLEAYTRPIQEMYHRGVMACAQNGYFLLPIENLFRNRAHVLNLYMGSFLYPMIGNLDDEKDQKGHISTHTLSA